MDIIQETKTEEHYKFFKSYFEFPVPLEDFLTGASKILVIRDIYYLDGLLSYTQVNKDRIHINFIVVSDKYKKQGFGTDLLNVIKEKNCKITCNVRESNTISLNFFNKHGFKEVGKDNYKNGDVKIMLEYAISK